MSTHQSITHWACDEDGGLFHDTLEDAVLSWLEDNSDEEIPDTLEVHGFAPLTPRFSGNAPDWFVATALEHLDEEYGHEDIDPPDQSADAQAEMRQAAEQFLAVVLKHYTPNTIDRVKTLTVNTRDFR